MVDGGFTANEGTYLRRPESLSFQDAPDPVPKDNELSKDQLVAFAIRGSMRI